MAQRNAETVRAWIDACNGDDPDAALVLCHPEIRLIEPDTLPGAATSDGIDAVRRYFAGWLRNWSEWEWRIEDLEELPPDKVLVTSLMRLRGLRSGIWVEHRWAYVFTLRDGKLLRQEGFDGRDRALASLGAG